MLDWIALVFLVLFIPRYCQDLHYQTIQNRQNSEYLTASCWKRFHYLLAADGTLLFCTVLLLLVWPLRVVHSFDQWTGLYR